MTTATRAEIDNRYRLVRRVGRGGTGTVYQAVDLLLGRTVAVKALDNSFALGLLRDEGRSLARLQHPNVVTLYDLVQSEGRAYLVMEYVEGCDLDAWLQQRGPLLPAQALAVFRTIASAIGHAHSRGLLHCDLKPANVLISGSGEIKLTDFTLGRLEINRRFDGVAGGTAPFAAPEQMGSSTVDRRTDIFGLGMLLRRLIEEPDIGMPEGASVAAIIARATALEPDSRFATVEEMLTALPQPPSGVTALSPVSVTSDLTKVSPVDTRLGPAVVTRWQRWNLLGIPAAIVIAIIALALHLTASASPAPVVLPSLVSTDSRSAQLVARSFDLQTRIVLQYSAQAAAGVVIRQDPRAGTNLARGAIVTLIVSNGPRPVQIPDAGGMSGENAIARLRAAGFRVAVQKQDDVFGAPDRVLSEVPPAHTTALPHALVTLTISQAPWWEFWR